jgi:hypothetical protein
VCETLCRRGELPVGVGGHDVLTRSQPCTDSRLRGAGPT